MKTASTLIAHSLLLASAAATKLYVTSYAGTISSLSLEHDNTGRLTLDSIYNSTGCGESPSWLTFDSDRRILYCMDEGLESTNGSVNSLLVGDDGKLTQVTHLKSISGPVSGVLYGPEKEREFFTAHYSGSAVSTWSAPRNGSLDRLKNVTFSISQSGPDADRQAAPHPHEAILDPTGKFILVPDLGMDLVHVFGFEAVTGKLVPKEPLHVAAGYGPRHAAFWTPVHSNDTTYMYLATELSNKVLAYSVTYQNNSMAFKKVYETNSFGGQEMPEGAATAEIAVSPDNRFLVVSIRNDTSFSIPNYDPKNSTLELSDTMATFSLQSNGSLALTQLWPAGGSYPRAFEMNAEGDMIAIPLQYSARVVILERDVKSGKLGNALADYAIPGNLTSVVWDEQC
ncbi:putative isomerase YbhE [Saccharata proteae CBS 121410]|uniref:Isomerase YbhE n=1 Tax=Saccharata proteae CBS 121410 TaxID=1314787 RepID=A0A9P4M0F2_9PEZI|nr:putative isomerase YbhE [Saccharata proteae CBS 121410]